MKVPLKISIITPSYNQSAYLEETIESVLSQAFQNLEYIIIDGGSSDGSVDIIKKNEKYLKYWVSEKDGGQSHAINKGLKYATGEVVNWINSDDYLEAGALKYIASAFEDPARRVICGRSNIIKADQIIAQSKGTDLYENNLAKSIGLARIDQPETWFRKAIFDQIGPLNESLHFVMDRELWIRYLLLFGHNGIFRTDKVLANFRLHENSKTVSQKQDFVEENNQLYAALSTLANQDSIQKSLGASDNHSFRSFEVNPELPELIVANALTYFLLQQADYYYQNYQYEQARNSLALVSGKLLASEDKKWYWKLRWRIPMKINKFRKWMNLQPI